MTILHVNGNPTPEAEHYACDSSERLLAATFAQTPVQGYTPPTGQHYYNNAEPAIYRARASYDYDPGGRVRSVNHWWHVWGSSAYTSTAILGNSCDYELSGLNRGLKMTSAFSVAGSTVRTETYGYDSQLDYLTSASYDDGLANENPTWTYDAAWNRTDSVCDNLNRTTSIGGIATTCDILGNRKTMGSNTYSWDCLNRMTGYNADTYEYRADGMRVAKTVGSTTSYYRYDGQMGFEDLDVTSGTTTVNDYGIGARGIDYIAKTVPGTTTVGYPIYDAHGNMTACLFRSGSSYSINNQRSYDAWGVIRQGSGTGDPKGRYCAGLGHKQDDESGLVYMRSRYCDTGSGRFLSEDTKRTGQNWFVYACDNPVGLVDPNGKDATDWLLFVAGIILALKGFFAGELIDGAGGVDRRCCSREGTNG